MVDFVDKCLDLVGLKFKEGCLDILEEVKKVLIFVFKVIEFEIGSDVIKKNFLKIFEEIVNILIEYLYYLLKIGGYMDSCGNDKLNLDFFWCCVCFCYNYLFIKGIDKICMNY